MVEAAAVEEGTASGTTTTSFRNQGDEKKHCKNFPPSQKKKMTVAADPNALHGFSKPQVEKAAGALLAHLRKNSKGGGGGGKSNDLFEDDDELLYMVRSFAWRRS